MSTQTDLGPVTVHLTGPLSGVRHNIEHYERMHEFDITPESRKRTLDDLRIEEARLVDAIALLKSRSMTQPKEGLSDAEIERHADELYPNIPEIPKQQEDRETFVLHFQYIRDKGLLSPSVDVRGLVEAGDRMRNVCNWIARELVHPKLELTRHGDMEAFISLCKQWDTAKGQGFTPTNIEDK